MKKILAGAVIVICLIFVGCSRGKTADQSKGTLSSSFPNASEPADSSLEEHSPDPSDAPDEKEEYLLTEELQRYGLSFEDVHKIYFYDAAMGEGGRSTDSAYIQGITDGFVGISFYKEEPEIHPTWESLSHGCLYWFEFYNNVSDEEPWFCIALDPFFFVVNGETAGPYTLVSDEIIADILKSTNSNF